jgi:hypothetical protein
MVLGAGDININAPLVTTGTTSGGNGAGGNISLSTQNGDINLNAGGTVNAEGGDNTLVDGGNLRYDRDQGRRRCRLGGTRGDSDRRI